MPERPGERYDRIGRTYAAYRKPDDRIAEQIDHAIGDVHTVVDVGSGAGSYEPNRPRVVAVEPSLTMIAQRAPGAAPVVRAVAEALPFPDDAFDVGLALLTIHHWQDVRRGFDELERVAARAVFFTWDADVYHRHWLFTDYLPELPEGERELPTLADVLDRWPNSEVEVVPVPWDCTDGFCAAYWRRPEMYLDARARAAISGLAQLSDAVLEPALARLDEDVRTGRWQERNARLVDAETWDCGYRLVLTR